VPRNFREAVSILCPASLLSTLPLLCHAQAGVQRAGEGDVTFYGQNINHTRVIGRDGSTLPGGHAYNRSIAVEFDYGLTNRLSITVGLPPYVLGRYWDEVLPPPPVSPGDSCRCLQASFQDFGLSARYALRNSRRFILTPTISAGIPSHDYAYEGESVAGRNLRELALGINTWRRLDFLSRNASLSTRYAYTFSQEALGISTNRSNLTVEGDYELLPNKLGLRSIALLQQTHGGVQFGELRTADEELRHQRDRLFRDRHIRAGAGASYQLGRAEIFGSMIFHVIGRNTHAENILTVAVRVPFQWRPGYRSPSNQ
jgi:hypothetical protein